MREVILKKKKFLQFPEMTEHEIENSLSVEKLSLHGCYNGKLVFQEDQWPNLRYLEMISCRYLEIAFYYPQNSPLTQLYLAQDEYIDIGDFGGNFPQLELIRIDNCNYIKFKGKFKGNVMLRKIKLNRVMRSSLFHHTTHLPQLAHLVISNQSNFCKIDLQPVTAPNLRALWFENSNYLQIKSLGNIGKQLQSFKFENCAYPKLNVDFSTLVSRSPLNELEEVPEVFLDANVFRIVDPNHFKKLRKTRRERLANSPDMELFRQTASQAEAKKKAQIFLESSDLEDSDSNLKYCPECGTPNPKEAGFCAQCGNQFHR